MLTDVVFDLRVELEVGVVVTMVGGKDPLGKPVDHPF